jgi:pilus assembly protein CpaB
LLVALLAGGLAAWLATRGGSEPEQAAPQIVQEARARVLVAAKDVGIGQRLGSDDLVWQDWPEGAVRGEYITEAATPNAIGDMQGAVARFELFPGEPILQAKLVRSDQGYLSAVLDKGMRGISLSVTADSASGGFIVPNDHVDVILSSSSASGVQSQTILSNVRVLAINTRLGETGTTGAPDDGSGGDGTGDPKSQVFANTAIATLELDPGQAEMVINATQLGKLSLVLRSIVDFTPAATDNTEIKHNAPIKIIRYGQEVNITAPAPTGNGDTAAVDTAAFRAPAVTISPAVTPLD